MVKPLIEHIFFEQILSLLPVRSNLSSYADVENVPTFVSCRSVLINLVSSQGLDSIVVKWLDLIDLILSKNNNNNSSNSNSSALPHSDKETVHSVLVLTRLLNDVLESHWDKLEEEKGAAAAANQELHPSSADSEFMFTAQTKLFTSSVIGYSIHRPSVHTTRPDLVNTDLIPRILDICNKLKFHTVTSTIIQNNLNDTFYSQHEKLYEQPSKHSIRKQESHHHHHHHRRHHHTYHSIEQHLLPDFAKYMDDPIAKKIDISIDYIQSYLAASNPSQFSSYVNTHILTPILHPKEGSNLKDPELIQNLDLLGCVYIKRESLLHFLNVIKVVINQMQDDMFNRIFLHYISKALLLWIITRPVDFCKTFHAKSYALSHKSATSHPVDWNTELLNIKQTTSSIFDSVYSIFNIANLFSNLNNSTSTDTETCSTAPDPETCSSNHNYNNSTDDESDTEILAFSHLENTVELYIDSENMELSSYTPILRFLSILIMLDTDVFNEINKVAFKYIPATPINNDKRACTHDRLKKLPKLPLQKSKPVKFLTILLRNFNGSRLVVDTAILDTLRSLICIFTMSSSVALVDPEMPFVAFSKRLFSVLGHNLNVGEEWKEKTNISLQECLSRNPSTKSRLQIEYFSAAIQICPEPFLSHLQLDTLLQDRYNLDWDKLNLYSEGFRVLYHLRTANKLWLKISERAMNFLKSLLDICSDTMLMTSPDLDENFLNIVSSMADGLHNGFFDLSLICPEKPLITTLPQRPFSMHSSSFLSFNSFDSSTSERSSSGPTPTQVATSIGSTKKKMPQIMNEVRTPPEPSTTFQKELHSPTDQSVYKSLNELSKSSISPTSLKTSFTNDECAVSKEGEDRDGSNFSISNLTALRDEQTAKIYTDLSSSETNSSATSTPTVLNILGRTTPRSNTPGRLFNNKINEYIMVNIFSVFRRMTGFLIINHGVLNKTYMREAFMTLIKPSFVAMMGYNSSLQRTSLSFLEVLISHAYNFTKNTTELTVRGYYWLAGVTTSLFSIGLLNLNISNTKRETFLELIVKLFKIRRHISQVIPDKEAILDVEKQTFPLMASTVSKALFISLYSNKKTCQKLLHEAYHRYNEALKFYQTLVGPVDPSWNDNLAFIKAMAKSKVITIGSVAVQRKIRKNIISYIKNPDATTVQTTDLMYQKWYYLAQNRKILNRENLVEFRNLAGILASVVGAMVFSGNLAVKTYDDDTLIKNIKYFIFKQCEWLTDSDLLTRENSKEILGAELHPFTFSILFRNLRLKVEMLSSVELSTTNNDFPVILLEQIIQILKMVLAREDTEGYLFLFSLDIIRLIDHLILIIEKMPHISNNYYKAIINICKVFAELQNCETTLAIKGHRHLKDCWLKAVIQWFDTAISQELDLANLAKSHQDIDFVSRDHDVICLDAAVECSIVLVYLTENVSLHIPSAISEEDAKRLKTVRFGNYFNILLKGLEKKPLLQKFPQALRYRITFLNDNVLKALTRLSTANIDAGLQFALPLGYSKNKDIKVAFLRVFTQILPQILKMKEGKEKVRMESSKKTLEYIIAHPEVVIKAANVCPADKIYEFSAGLVDAFDSSNVAHIIVAELIKDEISRASRPTDILRANSCATSALSYYSRVKGRDYLVQTLKPVLSPLLFKQEWFEVEKIDLNDDGYGYQVSLFMKYLRSIINSIVASVSYFPADFTVICQAIYEATQKKFPQSATIAVGSFIFLRFLCPALVNPEMEGIYVIGTHEKHSFITLARVLQTIANGSENFSRWSCLEASQKLLSDYRTKIFDFLEQICQLETKAIIAIPIHINAPSTSDFNFLHKYIYFHEFDIRQALFEDTKSTSNFQFLKKTLSVFDDLLANLDQPIMGYKNELPAYIKENSTKYPELFEFMSRHSFKPPNDLVEKHPYARESISSDGYPIITLAFRDFSNMGLNLDIILYRSFQVYANIWTNKHYVVLDCTEFNESEVDVPQLTSQFTNLLPEEAVKNCVGYYHLNVSRDFIEKWSELFKSSNVFVANRVPFYFINSSEHEELLKSLGLSTRSLEVAKDVRVSLHNIELYDPLTHQLEPVSLKLGKRYFQVLHERATSVRLVGQENLTSIKCNYVYRMENIVSVHVSSVSFLGSEFTVAMTEERELIFRTSKYLEIIKMFEQALTTLEYEFEIENSPNETQGSNKRRDIFDNRDTLSQLILMIFVGLFSDDDDMKNISYNLLTATQEAFKLDFGVRLHPAQEIFMHNDILFVQQISRSISQTAPTLSPFICKYFLDSLESGIIPSEHIADAITCLSHWVPNLYAYVYLADPEGGAESLFYIIRSFIRLTISMPQFTSMYLQEIWLLLALDGRLTCIIVDEVITHALERDSENVDWQPVLLILSGLQTVDMAAHVVNRLMKILKSFLPSLELEVNTQSWSELGILVKICTQLFFQAPLTTHMFFPEILFTISLLIDVGPMDIRYSFHHLLMNVSQSLLVTDNLTHLNKGNLSEVISILSQQKTKYIYGFYQDKGRILQQINSASFAGNFENLELFITNLVILLENSGDTEINVWKSRYQKHLLDLIFRTNSFLSARALMILGIIGKNSCSELLCGNVLVETMKELAEPGPNTEQRFILIAHVFTYSKMVENSNSSLQFLQKMFWLAVSFMAFDDPVLFQGALLFSLNCMKEVYMTAFEAPARKKSLPDILIEARGFAQQELNDIEAEIGITWNRENFPHNLNAMVMDGLQIYFVKIDAELSLEGYYRNAYYENTAFPDSTNHLCYLLFLFLLKPPKQLQELFNAIEYNRPMVELSENYDIPEELLTWLSAGSDASKITLYQAALLCTTSILDEKGTTRFLLLIKHLIPKQPKSIFNLYTIIRGEIWRISALEHKTEYAIIAFDIIGEMVQYEEYKSLDMINAQFKEFLESRGLFALTREQTNRFETEPGAADYESSMNPEKSYVIKRALITMIAKITDGIET